MLIVALAAASPALVALLNSVPSLTIVTIEQGLAAAVAAAVAAALRSFVDGAAS